MPRTHLPVARVIPAGDPVPDRLSLARCHTPRHDIGVAWPSGAAKIDQMREAHGFTDSEGSAAVNPRSDLL